MTTTQTRAIVPTLAQIEIDSAMVRTLAGRKAVLFATIDGDTVYTSLRMLTDNDTGKIATMVNSAIKFMYAHEFNDKSPIVLEFQTMQYGKANKFQNAVYSLDARMVERKSKTYFVALQKNGDSVWFTRSKDSYTLTTTPIVALGAHFTKNGTLTSLTAHWLKALDKGLTDSLDKRNGMVGGKVSDYGAYLLQTGKTDKSLKDYATKHGLDNAQMLALYNKPTLAANTEKAQ